MKNTFNMILTVTLIVASVAVVTINRLSVKPPVPIDPFTLPRLSHEKILANFFLTPGAINPEITESNYKDTLCNPKWHTSSIRPASSYTSQLKKIQIAQYGYTDTDPSHYEEDHLISLQLGGHPTAKENLWPQPYQNDPGAREKDAVENYLHDELCAGHLTLQKVQQSIKDTWPEIYTKISSHDDLGSTGTQGIQIILLNESNEDDI